MKAVNVGANTVEHMAPNTDYHMAFGQKMDVWGGNPWDWHTGTWYQTFVATGTGINRVSFKLASPAQTVRIAIHESNGGAVNTWPEVGPSRSVDAGCSGCDVWAAWRHGEIRTVPGRTYAVSFQNTGGSMGFFIHRDSHGPGYNEGTAYKDAQPQSFDLYAIVFSDNDGTLLTYQMENSDIGMATEWAGAWAQSFTAKGTSLAAVGLFAQNPNDPQWPADVLIFDGISGGQQGAQVGPRKQIRDAGWYGPGTGYGGMSYNRGEVPLTPGRKYLIVFSPYDFNGGGFNPLRRPGGNVLPDGEAYIGAGGTWVMKNYDLSMTILEYAADQTPTPTPTLGPTATPTAPPSSPTPTPPPGPAGLNVY